jgi:hypothetical protein
MESVDRSVPDGYVAATVGSRVLRHLVPLGMRLAVCGAPVASSSVTPTLSPADRVCPRCVDCVEGRRKPVPQPPVHAPRVPSLPSAVAPLPVATRPPVGDVRFELPGSVADMLAGTVDPVSRRTQGRGSVVTFALPPREAEVVAEVLAEAGFPREGARVRAAMRAALA